MERDLGLRYGTVRLTEWDAGWRAVFEDLAASIRASLARHVVAIEHVGSTAVPGLVSKPIIDIAVGLAPDSDIEVVVRGFQELGYEFRGNKEEQGGLLFVLEDHPLHRIAHVHAVRLGGAQWSRYLLVRDRLRADGEARRTYADIKRRLAANFPNDRAAYTAGKQGFLEALLTRSSPLG